MSLIFSDISRTMMIVGEIGRWHASALDPAQVPAPETETETETTNTASPGANMGKRAAIKATETGAGAGARATPPRSPRIKTGVDTDERREDGSFCDSRVES